MVEGDGDGSALVGFAVISIILSAVIMLFHVIITTFGDHGLPGVALLLAGLAAVLLVLHTISLALGSGG